MTFHLHHCKYKNGCLRLFHAIQKYGKEAFNFNVIEQCVTLDQLNEREIHWIKELNTLSPNGYNLQEGGRNGFPSEETRKKMGAWQVGRTISPETRLKIAETSKKRIVDPIAIAKTANSNRGRKHTQESINNVQIGRAKRQAIKDSLNPPTIKQLLNRQRKAERKLRQKDNL